MTASRQGRRWRLLLGTLAFATWAPPSLMGLPLAGLLLAARPRSTAEWGAATGVGLLSVGLLLLPAGDLLTGFVRAYTVLVAGAFTGGPSQASRLDEAWSLQLHDVLVVTRGRHLFRVGGQLKAKPQHIVDRSNFGGTFEFSSLDAFARGAPLLFRIRQGNPDASHVSNDAVAFAEADLRLTDALDFTAGLRYDWQSHLRDRDNVAPRASVAFAPGSRKTVFRAGAGVFYEQMADDAIARSLLFDGSHLHEAIVAEPTFPLPSPIRLDAPGTLWRIDPAARTPSTIQATVAVEREQPRCL